MFKNDLTLEGEWVEWAPILQPFQDKPPAHEEQSSNEKALRCRIAAGITPRPSAELAQTIPCIGRNPTRRGIAVRARDRQNARNRAEHGGDGALRGGGAGARRVPRRDQPSLRGRSATGRRRLAPWRAALIADAVPAGPPPITRTSQS